MSELIITRIPETQDPYFTEVETIWTQIEAAVNDNAARIEFLENLPPRHIKITFIDPVSTTPPSGPSVTMDGIAGENGDLALFTNLSTGNNRVYLLSGIGSNAVWTAQELFGPGDNLEEDPNSGDMITATKGLFFAGQTAKFDGTDWKVNEIIRLFNGGNFWEMTAIQGMTILNNTTANVFTVTAAGSEHMIINYSISRASGHETGQVYLSQDGSEAVISAESSAPGVSGVDFDAYISGDDLVLDYSTDNSGSNGKLQYFIMRWSDTIGGPAGIPNYAGSGGSLLSAAGNDTDVQFNDSGAFGADSRFQWDSTMGALLLNGLEIHGLVGPVVLSDDQTVPVTFLTIPGSYRSIYLDYDLIRDGDTQTGTITITNNGVTAERLDDEVDTALLGVNFTVGLNAGDIEVRYDTTATGFSSQLRYAQRRF